MDGAIKKKLLARIHRIVGQLEGVGRMVEEDRSCVDVLLQIASAQAALSQAGKVLLYAHVESCVSDAVATAKPTERTQRISELMEVFTRFGSLGKRPMQ